MKQITFTILFAIITTGLFSQEYEVPNNYKLEKAEDYKSYEQDVIDCVDWLINTPLTEQQNKRNEANGFLLVWLTGSPNVTVEINENIVTFMGSSPDLLMIFMGGWAKYSLEEQDFKNKVNGSLAGIESVIVFYTKNKNELGKNKEVEKYIKLQEKSELKAYVEENV